MFYIVQTKRLIEPLRQAVSTYIKSLTPKLAFGFWWVHEWVLVGMNSHCASFSSVMEGMKAFTRHLFTQIEPENKRLRNRGREKTVSWMSWGVKLERESDETSMRKYWEHVWEEEEEWKRRIMRIFWFLSDDADIFFSCNADSFPVHQQNTTCTSNKRT